MRKFFLPVIILILILPFTVHADVSDPENDPETHKIIGGLYSLTSAIELNARAKPDVNSLVRFFERIPPGWQNEIKIESDKKSTWVGIIVPQNESVRKYLRDNAKKLKILDAPNGNFGLAKDFAWVKACDIAKKKITVPEFSAASQDSTIFFSVDGSTWWAAWPAFNSRSIKEILDKHGTENHPELHTPIARDNSAQISIYDEVKPSSVRVPGEMRMGTKKSSFDMSMEIGDVIFNPIPNVHK